MSLPLWTAIGRVASWGSRSAPSARGGCEALQEPFPHTLCSAGGAREPSYRKQHASQRKEAAQPA
jgi:hypothetical protein